MSEGLLTLYDNGTDAGRAPRSVGYRIDEQARTATFVGQLTDRIAPSSDCCGSLRVLPGGNAVTAWGGNRWITEHRPDGRQVFRLDATFVYRAVPILPGQYTRQQFRIGMDAQFEGGVPVSGASVLSEVPGSSGSEMRGDIGFRLGR
jgi:hypothetical protein